jgi:hypothetical protein
MWSKLSFLFVSETDHSPLQDKASFCDLENSKGIRGGIKAIVMYGLGFTEHKGNPKLLKCFCVPRSSLLFLRLVFY